MFSEAAGRTDGGFQGSCYAEIRSIGFFAPEAAISDCQIALPRGQSMPDKKEFGVFLSHNSADMAEVVKLATKLKELGLNPWFDAWHLVAGEPWLPAIERALANSDSCAVAVGANGFGKVHEEEMWVALQRAMESKLTDRRYRVIPVLLPNGTRGDRAKLPAFLSARTWIEFYRSIDDPAALDKLARAIRGETAGAATAQPRGECPYRGLAYFDVQHAGLFFGREVLTDWLLSRLRGTASTDGPTRFLAIVGASGSGKSSLVRAGVLAKLKAGELPGSQNWPQIICRPENRPLESLATALAGLEGDKLGPIAKSELIADLTKSLLESSDKVHLVAQAALPANDPDWRMVVFVDQFEELFTLNVVEATDRQHVATSATLSADRVAFVRNLLQAATIAGGRTIVILTMRADFYGKCATLPELATAVSAHQELVGPMCEDELRRAIQTPAQLGGKDIDSGLVELLTKEVTDMPGALPLLQYALAELWEKSRELAVGELTTDVYRELGGWEGALSRRADAVLAEFKNTPQKKLVRELFLRLVQPGEGTEDTKRLVRWQELRQGHAAETAALEQTVRKLADNRLIITSGESTAGEELPADATVEVVHEALIRGWSELRKWLDADRAGLRMHRQLTEAANDWAKSHTEPALRDPSRLYTGRRLADAKEWADKNDSMLNDVERAFLVASKSGVTQRRNNIIATAMVVVALSVGWTLFEINRQNSWTAVQLVEQLAEEQPDDVDDLITEKIDKYRRWADPLLRNRFNSSTVEAEMKLRAAIALLPVDDAPFEYLREQLLRVAPTWFPVVRDALKKQKKHSEAIVGRLWDEAVKMPLTRESFQAACALATFAPEDTRWSEINFPVADHLMTLEASELVAWRTALSPARKQLLKPLEAIYRKTGAREQAHIYAAETLAEYAAEDPDTLFDLLADAEQSQFPTIYGKAAAAKHRQRVVKLCQLELAEQASEDASEEAKDALGRRQANAGVALLKLGAAEHVWKLLKHSRDPRARSYFIHGLSPLGGDPQTIIRRFDEEPDVSVRSALLLALGEFSELQVPPVVLGPLIDKLLTNYEKEPDPGLHAAVEWLLRHWGRADEIQASIDKLRVGEPEIRARQATDERQWYVNSQGQTFVILDAGTFDMGAPDSDRDRQPDEVQHPRRIDRRIAIAATEVTKQQYRRFLDAEKDVRKFKLLDQYSPTDDSPQIGVNWYDAARYCNWLSKVEFIREDQWCYLPNENNEYAEGMRPAPNFLERTGYRLPTEAEWEFACRADTVTSRYYGANVMLLAKYAWFLENSAETRARPVGLLKPNDFGLFDMLGNAHEWCHDVYREYPTVTDSNDTVNDDGDQEAVEEKNSRVLRGATFYRQSSYARSSYRSYDRPDLTNRGFGIRPARTYR